MRTPAPNTVVWIRQRPWRIERAVRDGDICQFDVVRGDERATFLAPFDRPIAGRTNRRLVRVRAQHGLAKVAASLANTWSLRMVTSARDARISLLPHQLEPALAVLEGHRRVLVADDVGLGKTIEAGLVIAELMRRSPACRVLVIAPAGLCQQWAEELASRFSLPMRCALDRSVVDTDSAARSRWRDPGVWLTSTDYVKQPHVLSGLPLAPWDLVVIDEAHTVAGRTDRHDACAELVRRARHALLLSATPHSGDVARFARLLDLGAFEAAEPLLVFRRTRESVGLPRRRNTRWTRVELTDRASGALDALRRFECAILSLGRRTRRDALLLLLSVFRRRALSSFAAFERSLERRLTWLSEQEAGAPLDAVQPTLDFGDADDHLSEEDLGALTADAGVAPVDERRLIGDLIRITRGALADDPKLARISRLVRRSKEPVVIFTEFRDSLEAVHEVVSRSREAAVLHGGQSEAERSRELARFLEGQASVLIATDVAGQGLNLQSRARWIVNLELPWNPTRLEQRIGRVDRIGQARVVHASVLLARHHTEAALVQALARRAVVANQALAGDRTMEAPISPLALASAVVGGEPLAVVPTRVSLPAPSTTWVRAARANVAVLTRRRKWRTSWRGSMDRQGRPVEFSSRRRSPAAPYARAILGFSIPIVDSCGLVIERHLVAVSVTPAGVRDGLAFDRAAGEVLHLSRRLTRATALAADCSTRRQLAERAIGRHLISLCRSGDSQPELFTRRTLRLLQRAQTAADRLRDTVSAQLAREAASSRLSLGSPELVWLWRQR